MNVQPVGVRTAFGVRDVRFAKRIGRSAGGLLALMLLATTVVRIVAGQVVGLGYGESYHFSCAIRPSIGYFDHPPLSMLMGTFGLWLAGAVSSLAVRMPFIVLFVGTSWLLFLVGRQMFGRRAGFFAALLLNLSAVFTLSTAVFLQPDGPLMFFWLACSACLARIFLKPDLAYPHCWWVLVGITLGLAMLSKYHGVLLIFGAGMYALTVPDARKWIVHPGPYLAMLTAAIVFSPVLVWNYQHDWISFLWQSNRGLESHGIRWDWLARNLGGQALWILPWIWAPLLWELPKCFIAGPKDKARWLVAWLAVAPIVGFTVVSAYAPIGFHFHWQAPGYLMLLLPLGQTVARKLEAGSRLTLWWLRLSAGFTTLAVALLIGHAATGFWNQLGPQWLSQKVGEPDDPLLEVLDFHTLEAAFRERGLLDDPNLFVITNRWFLGGKVDYALKGAMPVLCLHPKDQRGFAFWDSSDRWLGKDAILVAQKKFLLEPEEWYADYFERFESLGTVDVTRGRHVVLKLYLYRCCRLKKPYPNPYRSDQ